MSRSKSSLATSFVPETKLPGLRHGTQRIPDQRAVTQDEISELKLRTHELENQRKLLRAKIQRMQKIIQRRGASIKQVLSQSQKEATLRTASESTLERLRDEKIVLQNTLETHQQELDQLRHSDRVSLTQELKVAIPLVYAEMKRLSQETEEMKHLEGVMRGEYERLQAQIANIPANEKAIDDYQFEIDELTEKLFAYKKSEMKILTAEDLQKLHEMPESYDQIRKKLEDEICSLREMIEVDQREISEIQESETRNLDYLNQIIQRQADMIRQSLEVVEPPAEVEEAEAEVESEG
jgi:chromosome segregation ATPase